MKPEGSNVIFFGGGGVLLTFCLIASEVSICVDEAVVEIGVKLDDDETDVDDESDVDDGFIVVLISASFAFVLLISLSKLFFGIDINVGTGSGVEFVIFA